LRNERLVSLALAQLFEAIADDNFVQCLEF